jgi:hypothetical protein
MDVFGLIRKFLPVFFFHTLETYMPSSMEYALENSQFYKGDIMVADYGKATPEMFANNVGHRIRLDPSIHIGEFHKKSSDDIPIYVSVKDYPDKDFYEILYIVYFPYSAPYRILWNEVGAHDSDLEHIAVRVSKQYGDLLGVYYSYHSEGKWCHPNEIEYIDNRPVVYVAKGSHGFYPYSGKHWRIFGFANDVMNNGLLWNPSRYIRVDINPPYWMSYRGQLSMNGVDNIPLKGWFKNLEPEESSTELRDCIFPCWYPSCFLCRIPFVADNLR